MEVPKNMVVVTATVRREVGGMMLEHTTSLSAQTHKLDEVDYLIQRAWKATKEQIEDAASSVRPPE